MTIRTVTVSGVTAVNFDPENKNPYFFASEKYAWIKNNSDAAMYVSLDENCTAGAAGTAMISSGECGRIELSPANALYISGSGSAEIRTGDTAECPFKVQAGGGDLSDYYTKSEVDSAMLLKANSADVYTKTQADDLFVAQEDIDIKETPTTAEINAAIADIWGA